MENHCGHIVEFVGVPGQHQHVCEGPVILGYQGDPRMRLIFRRWMARGWCVGCTLPLAHVAGGQMWDSEKEQMEHCLSPPSPTEQ